MNTNGTQIFILSQQFLFRQGIEHSLTPIEDVKVSGNTEVSEEVIQAIDALPPDVALVDIDNNQDSGLSLIHKIKQHSPNIGIIVFSSNPSDAELFVVLKAQAAAYVSKDITFDQLVDTIRRVSRGEHPINESLVSRPKVAEHVLRQFQELSWQSESEAVISPLTAREKEILDYVAQGFLNKQIAAKLGISEQTIKNHVTSILRKLNANARTEAVVIAIKQGLITVK